MKRFNRPASRFAAAVIILLIALWLPFVAKGGAFADFASMTTNASQVARADEATPSQVESVARQKAPKSVASALLQPSPADEVQVAWRRAQLSGAYRFATEIVQTTYPAPRLTNVGRSSRVDALYIEGELNLPQRAMQMVLWQDGGSVLDPGDGIEMRIQGDKAYGRQSGGAWQEIDDFSGAFAPGQDLMAYLAGARNVRRGETRTLAEDQKYVQYIFDLDGPAFAAYMRDQLEQELREKGELPAGLTLGVSDEYRNIVGAGEVWLDSDGLPFRLKVRMEYPQQENGERIVAEIKTDFSQFDRTFLAQIPTDSPLEGAALAIRRVQRDWDWGRTAGAGGALALFALMAMMAMAFRESKKVYAAFASALIISMLITPLLQTQQALAFNERQSQRQAEVERQQQEQETVQELQDALLGSDWDPLQDPLAAVESNRSSVISKQSDGGSARADADEKDDGTIDDETIAELNPIVLSSIVYRQFSKQLSVTQELSPDSDADHDGLTYLQETRLGTDPNNADSDGDLLRDDLEVKGFELGGKRWYSDPLNADTNNDGQLDALECWGALPQDLPSNLPCDLDADKDGTPDLFDRDNDGDRVSDRVDLSPNRTIGDAANPFDKFNPFKLIIDNLQANANGDGYPVFVDLQLRPKNPDHLSYAMNVLDWPTGDDAGQITRLNDDVFADYMNPRPPADNANWNGDMRLVPLLEIMIPATGDEIPPLRLTNPRATRQIDGWVDETRWISATIAMEQQGDDARLDFALQDVTAGVTVEFYDGPCSKPSNNPVHRLENVADGDTRVLNGQNLVDLLDGRHVVVLRANGEATCSRLGDIPNGPYADKMIDTEDLLSHGISVRDADDKGNVVAYVPLNLVKDETGGGKAAFAARMLYWSNGSGFWGKAHEMRVVWLVQMLGDNGGVRMVQTYADEWFLTGLSVREDRGMDVAIAFENPDADSNVDADDALWQVGRAMQTAFVGGRDQDGDGERDLTIAEFKARFDNASNDPEAKTKRWGVPAGAVTVLSYSYPDQDYLAEIPTNLTPSILNTYFIDNGQPRATAPTLLFAREEHYRQADLDMSDGVVTIRGDEVLVDMAANKVAPNTLATVSWSPFRYRNGAWEAYPLDEYYDLMGVRFKELFEANPPLDEQGQAITDPVAIDGLVAAAQSYYFVLNLGKSGVPESGDLGLITAKISFYHDDASLANGYINDVGGVIEFVGDLVAEDFFSALQSQDEEISELFGNLFQQDKRGKFKIIGDLLKGKAQEFKNLRANAYSAAGTTLLAATLAMSIAATAGGGKTVVHIKNALSAISALKDVVDTVQAIKSASQGVKGVWNSMKAAGGAIKGAALKAGIVALVIAIAVTAGMFIAQWASGALGPIGGLQFNAALAGTIATIIASVILLAIALIPVVGQIIAAVVAAVDAVIQALCAAFDWQEGEVGKWFCKGLSGLLAEGIKWAIFSQNALVGNMDDKDRTQTSNFDTELVDAGRQYSAGNIMKYSMDVETAITLADLPIDWKAALYLWQFSYANLDSATFRYALREGKIEKGKNKPPDDIKGVERNQMEGEWRRKDGYFKGEDALVMNESLVANLVFKETGINQAANLYLSEAYAVPVQECWILPTLPPTPICYIRTDDNDGKSNHTYLGKNVVWDIFPATLDEFYDCESGNPAHPCNKDGGFSLAWGQTGSLTFPRMKDFDGDGLLGKADGGNDPNDSKADSDRDGLWDPFELELGSDPQLIDTDGDGLSDYEEVVLGSNPTRKDSDGDGLTDKQELEGWEYIYDYAADGSPLISWVRSDPMSLDSDGDALTDFQEKAFGFHPFIPNDPNVMDFESQAREANAPMLLLRFEENAGATLFADVSGETNNAVCEGDGCPVAGHEGRYGNAAVFDGNDQITVDLNAPSGNFTLAAWVKYTGDNPGSYNTIMEFGDDAPGLFMRPDGALIMYPVEIQGGTIPRDTWTHVAYTWDGSFSRLYVNGDLVAEIADGPGQAGQSGSGLGIGHHMGDTPWQGRIDEVAVFPVALPPDKIQELRDARYNPNDFLVKPGDVIAYKGQVTNNLFSKVIDGLLFTDLPGGLESAVQPAAFSLAPDETSAISGNVVVKQDAESGRSALTLAAGGVTRESIPPFDMGDAVLKMTLDEWGSDFYYGLGWTSCSGDRCPSRQEGVGGGGAQAFGGDDYIHIGNINLDLSANDFTFSAWLYPDWSDAWRGVWGSSLGDADAYPSVAIRGRDLRFGFGDGVNWLEHTSYGALRIGQWSHVVITFDGDTYKLYVNGDLKDQTSDPFAGRRPVYNTAFELGRASNKASVFIDKYEVLDENDGGWGCNTGDAEIFVTYNGEEISLRWGIDEGDWENIQESRTFYENAEVEVWEDDERCGAEGSGNDRIGRVTFSTNEPGYPVRKFYFGDGVSEDSHVDFYVGFDNPSQPYSGLIDEFALYKRVMDAEEVLRLYRSGITTVEMRFDDPPGAGRSGQGFANHAALSSGRNGACSGDSCPTSGVPGHVNQAAWFDGVDDYVQLADANVLGLKGQDFTVAAWVNVSQFNGGDETILGMDAGGANAQLHLVLRDQKPYMGFNANDLAGNRTLSANAWYHIVWRYSSSTGEQAIFVNGVKDAFQSGRPPFQGDGPVNVGRWGYGNYFNGRIDDLRVFQKALDDAEIARLYREAPRLLLHLDELEGAAVFEDDGSIAYGEKCGLITFDRVESRVPHTSMWNGYLYFNDEWLSYFSGDQYTFSSDTRRRFCGVGKIEAAADMGLSRSYLDQNVEITGPGQFSATAADGGFELYWTISDVRQVQPPSCTDCPGAGRVGKIGAASADFDGIDDFIQLPEAGLLGLSNSSFTVMAWIRGDYFTPQGINAILGTDENSNNRGLHLGVLDGKPYMGFYGNDTAGATQLAPNVWYHLAFRYDREKQEQAIFVNGYLDKASVGHGPFQGDGLVNIGRALGGSYFNGRIDELTIYTRALNEFDIRDIALSQQRWFGERQSFELTIDADKPDTRLRSYQEDVDNYRPNRDVVLDVQASDATSEVTLVELGIWKDGWTGFVWSAAPPCQDASAGAAWCPTFDPPALGGEGTYTLRTRAVDAVGNRGESWNVVFYVDATPPDSVTADFADGALLSPQLSPEQHNVWVLPLSGSASDPVLSSGAAGSGVAEVTITLLDAEGKVAGAGAQQAVIADGRWSVDYLFYNANPSGLYTVMAEAADAVGNRPADAFNLGTIYLDATAPTAKFETTLQATGILTATDAVTTTPPASDGAPSLADATLYWPLDEDAGATTFADASGNGHAGTCSGGACPTAGVNGQFGQAVQFDGTDDFLAGGGVDLANQSFTVAFWAKRDATGRYDIVVGQGAESVNQGLHLGFRDNDKFTCDFYGNGLDTPAAYTDTAWHHWACTYDASTQTRTIYRDGVKVAQDTASANYQGSGDLWLGRSPWNSYFRGLLDEFQVYPRALSADEVASLTTAAPDPTPSFELQGWASESLSPPGALLRLRLDDPAATTVFTDTSGAGRHAECSGDACPTVVAEGRFGRALQFDGWDDFLNVEGVDLANESFTVAFWAKRNTTYSDDFVIAQGTGAANQGLEIGLLDNGTFYCGFWNDDLSAPANAANLDWHHWACTYDAATKRRAIYRDGVLVAEDTAAADYQGTGNLYVGRGLYGSEFDGKLDEIAVFERALDVDEIRALAQAPAAGVQNVEVGLRLISSQTPSSPSGQALYLPLDDAPDANGNVIFRDLSGNDRYGDCSVSGCPTVGAAGHFGAGVAFDGQDDAVYVSGIDLANKSFTVAFWAKREAIDRWDIVVSQGEESANRGLHLGFRDNNRFTCDFYGDGLDTDEAYADTEWHHWACTYDATTRTRTIYRDGEQVAQDAAAEDYQGSGDFRLGLSPWGTHYAGALDEVRVFERALTRDEIQSLLGAGPLLALPFDEPSASDGVVLSDDSGWGRRATLNTGNECRIYASADTPIYIPDGGFIYDPSIAISSLTVPDDFTLADINLTMNIDFPIIHYLDIALIAPNGETATVIRNLGWRGTEANFTDTILDNEASSSVFDGWPPYTGRFRPEAPLSALSGQSAKGTWQLKIANSSYGWSARTGYLQNWSLELCPVLNEVNKSAAGRAGAGSLRFDGVDDYVNVEGGIDLANRSFTIAFWAKRNVIDGRAQFIVGQGEASENRGLHIGFRDDNRFTCDFYGNGLSTAEAYTDTEWHQWACTYDATTNLRTIYRDGAPVAWDTVPAPYQGDGDLLVGKAPWGDAFNGLVDDVQIHPMALEAAEIQALGQSAWQSATLAANGPGAATWTYPLPATEGDFRIDLRSTDAGNVSTILRDAWRGLVDTLAPRVSVQREIVGDKYRYTTIARDFNLSETGFRSPCGAGVITNRVYQDGVAGSGRRLTQITAQCDLGAAPSWAEVGVFKSSFLRSVAAAGDYVYAVGASWRSGLWIIDVSDPANPQQVGFYDVSGSSEEPWDVAVAGNYAYIADSNNNGLRVIDVSDPKNPHKVGDLRRWDARRTRSVAVSGDYAYLLDDPMGLMIANVSNPSSPWWMGRLSQWLLGYPQDIAVVGSYAYIAAGDSGLKIVNVSDPNNPWVAGTSDTPGFAQGVAVAGNYAYVADGGSGLRVIDVSDPANPFEVTAIDTPGDAKRATVAGNFVYIADGSRGLRVIDVTDPAAPVDKGGVDTPGDGLGLAVVGAGNGKYAFVADGWEGVRVIQTSGGVADSESATACDVFGRCATAEPPPVAAQSLLAARPTQTAWPEVFLLDAPTVLRSADPITLTVFAQSSDFLRELTLSVDGATLDAQSWSNGAVTETLRTALWTPSGEGAYALAVAARDWLDNTSLYTTTVIVDMTPPAIIIATDVLTGVHQALTGQLSVTGLVTDAIGAVGVVAEIDGRPAADASLDGNAWTVDWFADVANPADGVTVPITATVVDMAGYVVTATKSITVDVVAPVPVQLSLSSNQLSAISPTATVREVSPTLTLTWTQSSSPDIAGYRVDWIAQTGGFTQTAESQQDFAATDPLSAQYAPDEAQKLDIRFVATDALGNPRRLSFGPIYVDAPLTPDYVDLPDDGRDIYTGWMDSGCTLVGADNRIRDKAQEGAALDNSQYFYTSWDAQGLRLTWSGANWDTDGDLFIYLDTRPGGTTRAYHPSTITDDNTAILLPPIGGGQNALQAQSALSHRALLKERVAAQASSRMAADYLIWVQTSGSAVLMQWDALFKKWEPLDGDWDYAFDAGGNAPMTHFYIPFALLDIENPDNASLSLVALATENNGLRTWAAMPSRNPVNSPRILDAVVDASVQLFPLTQAYTWSSLGAGVCPNGSNQSAVSSSQSAVSGQQASLTIGADVRLSLSGDPAGIAYSVLGDNLFFVMSSLEQFAGSADWDAILAELCQANPDAAECDRQAGGASPGVAQAQTAAASRPSKALLAQNDQIPPPPGYGGGLSALSAAAISGQNDFNPQNGLASLMDVDNPPLGDGQEITFTLRYVNRGDGPATGLMADIVTWGPMRLPEGTPLTDSQGDYDWLLLSLGDLAAGEEKIITFRGRVDLNYDPGNRNGWATIDAIIYDDTGSVYQNQLEWMYMDFQYDDKPPAVGVSALPALLAPGVNMVRGYAFDDSDVSSITLDNAAQTWNCPDDAPADGVWSCAWDVGDAGEGQTFELRAKATDVHGLQTPDWTNWQTFTVDATPPQIAFDAATEAALEDGLVSANEATFSGTLTDNRLVFGVEAVDDQSAGAPVAAEFLVDAATLPRSVFSYDDAPETPLPLGSQTTCFGGAEIFRTFSVPDSFTVADVDLALNIDHEYRYDVTGWLVSPSGKWAAILWNGTSARNYDMTLNDAATQPVGRDKMSHDTDGPYYENERRPDQPLSLFNGEQAQGDWQLILCDYFPDEDDGFYNRSRLILTADSLPENTRGLWTYELPNAAGQDNVVRTVAFTGVDSVGNRSAEPLVRTFRVDTVAPAITVTHAITQVSLLDVGVVMSGTVGDGSEIVDMQAIMEWPNGAVYSEPVTRTGESWLYAPSVALAPGAYTVRVQATDEAGNLAGTGPYVFDVTCIDAAPVILSLGAEPDANDPSAIALTAVISNTGETLPAGASVAFYVDGEIAAVAATSKALADGETEEVRVVWDAGFAGDYRLSALINVDADGAKPLALCNAGDEMQQTLFIRTIELNESWNLISFSVDPFNPDAEAMQRPIAGKYALIQGFANGETQVYQPGQTPEKNTLAQMDAEHGYWIKVTAPQPPDDGQSEPLPAAVLQVVGETLPEDHPLHLDAGWNLISFLPAQAMSITTALQNIDGFYTAVLGYEQGAESYYTALDETYNTLHSMKPGRGYWIKMSKPYTLTYPTLSAASTITESEEITTASTSAPIAKDQNALDAIREAARAAGVRPTNTWVNFYGDARLPSGQPLPVGAVVKAIDSDGVVCGATIVSQVGQYGLLPCYGDDPTTSADEGAEPGDLIRLVADGQKQAIATWGEHGELIFAPLNALYSEHVWMPMLWGWGAGEPHADNPLPRQEETPTPNPETPQRTPDPAAIPLWLPFIRSSGSDAQTNNAPTATPTVSAPSSPQALPTPEKQAPPLWLPRLQSRAAPSAIASGHPIDRLRFIMTQGVSSLMRRWPPLSVIGLLSAHDILGGGI